MKINIIKTVTALIFVGFIAIPAFVGAQVPATDGGDVGGADVAVSSPSTDGANTGGADSNTASDPTPSTDGANVGGADSNTASNDVPATDGGNTGGADSNVASNDVPATDGGNTGGADTGTPSNPSNGGSNESNGNGASGSSRNSRSTATLPVLTSIANCSYINDYLKFDGANNAAEVSKLQTFLKNTEKLDVDINGKFDQKTFDAVKAFQAKYVKDVMAPWGVTTPTGQVFFTTKKKINEIYCKSTFTLTPAQIAQIEAYRKGIVDGTVEVAAEINATGTTPLAPEVGTNENSQTAAVGSFASRIWNFVKWLFGY